MASATATLSVLAGAVQLVPASTRAAEVANDGANLAVGDRVITGPAERALVTFLDGSTLTVEPNSDIMVQQADLGQAGGGSIIDVHINLGTVWARVVQLADPESSFSLESDTAVAAVHDGLPGARQNPDGTFQCWTFSGAMTVTDRNDGGKVSIDPHQTVLIQGDQIGAPRPIALSRSTLKIASSLDVLPLVEMPDQQRAAGFVSPGVEVNQVFGSFTGIIAGMRVVEVPAGEAGPFTLVLAGTESDPYLVRVTAQVDGQPVSSENISGYLARGSQQSMQITLVFQADSAGNPATAVVDHAEAGPLLAFFGDDVLGKVLLSPSEVARIVGN